MSSRFVLNIVLATVLVVAGVLLFALVTRFAAPRVDPMRVSNPGQLAGRVIQVEILNGSGIDDLAADTRNYIREHGFDVVKVGNYTRSDMDSSIVIDRVGDLESAKKVANILGIAHTRVLQEIDLDVYLDASIILGMDYESLRPFRSRKSP
ncbi:MAG: LytR C-terminal domain-containing protein [Rhodothermales bacterium]|nr:LytR C-terminal domain-containing protein [Rhodothermales bacterium]